MRARDEPVYGRPGAAPIPVPLHCGGCQRIIRRTNELCGCGFQNDVRGHRNYGGWAASDHSMPF